MASLDRKWLFAQLNLAWRVVVHNVKRLWPWSTRYGIERFQQNYVVEGLPPSSGDFRLLAHEAGRCTTCGACDIACPILSGTSTLATDARLAFIGPMAFVVSGVRAAPHLSDIASTLEVLNGPVCADCRACDAACPERIAIAKLAVVFADQLRVIVRAKQGVLPIVDAKRALPAWVARPGKVQER